MAQKTPQQLTRSLPLVKRYIQKLREDQLPIEQIILFGSRVKGEAREDSDIDLCVVSPKFQSRSDAFQYLWSKRDRGEILSGLEPVGYPPSDFVDEDPLVWEIKSTGIHLFQK